MQRTLGLGGRLVEYGADVAEGNPESEGAGEERRRERPTLLTQLAALWTGERGPGEGAETPKNGRPTRERAKVLRLPPLGEAPGQA